VLERADLIFSVSHSVKKEYIEMGVPEEKMVVMPNGVNHSLFVPMVEEEAREKLKNYLKQKGIELNLGENIILFVGYLRKRKGVDYLVEAMPEVVKKHKDTTLFLVGEGILEKDLKRRAVELGIRKNLVFISNVPHTQMPLFINASNLIVLPTLAEGRPNIVLEAMLCGKAVVATNVSGIPELITDGKEGILVEPRKKEQLSDAISLVLEDLELRKKLGKNARSRILSLGLDWKTYGKKVRKEYESLLSRKEKKGTISAYS
ncbi:MAG TPA: glycosyltransferase family 1 protein, partial [Thermoplasmata archaeon]|nr:glycosyltransferase family 1 protein [Thermoplasmata archaeon]